MKRGIQFGLAALVVLLAASQVQAQNSSLLSRSARRGRPTLQNTSRMHVVLKEPGEQIRKHDTITVVVNESQQYLNQANVNRQTQSNLDARLRDWLKLDGIGVSPAPMENGSPRVRGSLDSQLRTQMNEQSKESLQFRIAAKVIDVLPNGLLVIEARKQQKVNDDTVEASLFGLVKREDVLPNNTVLSDRIADLQIEVHETGHTRDAARRGWLLKALDFIKPF